MFDKKILSRGKITGIGNALVDLLVHETIGFVDSTDAAPGGMTYFDRGYIEAVAARATRQPRVVPGGAVCNTMIGIGRLGMPSRFVGKRGSDDRGAFFESDLRNKGVEPALRVSDTATGRVLSIITPDAQRTMLTYLGAAAELDPEEVTSDLFADSAVAVVEGYLLFNRKLIFRALDAAREAGALISLDLSSFTVVEAAMDILDNLLERYVDILLANEDEARAFTGAREDAKALKMLSRKASLTVLKVGRRGSYIVHDGQTLHVPAVEAKDVIDTTGAGDLYAAGLLYGLVSGLPLEDCGRIATACGYEVCRVVGADIPEEGWTRIRSML